MKSKIFKIIYTIVLATSLLTCGKNHQNIFINPNYSDIFSIQTHLNIHNSVDSKNLALWSNDRISININNESSIKKLLKKTKNKKLVMVSYEAGSQLENLINKDLTKILSLSNSYDEEFNHALVLINDVKELNYVASLSHQNKYHACGTVELLDLNLTTTSDPTVYASVLNETQTFAEIKNYLNEISIENIKDTIQNLQNFGTRFHDNSKGLEVPAYIQSQINEMNNNQFNVSLIENSKTLVTQQQSVVAQLKGTKSPEVVVILGSHLDSINRNNEADAPGADDNATGVAILLEVIRLINLHGLKFERTIEFHFYGAEEIGLVGSKVLASNYLENNIIVAGLFQLDMTGWSSDPKDENIFVIENETNDNLRRITKNLISSYLDGKFIEKILKIGTSDHASWHRKGFPVIFTHEDPNDNNPYIHSNADNIGNINNFNLTLRFAKLAMAFSTHFAGVELTDQTTTTTAEYNNDLKIYLIEKNLQMNQWILYVGCDSEVEKIEICKSISADQISCSTKLQEAIFYITKAKRNIFILDSIELTDTNYLLIRGIDKNGKISHSRFVKLTKK